MNFIIVGGGVVGLTSAQALLQAGYGVTLVERGSLGREASWAGGGILSPLCPWQYPEPVTRLTQHGMRMFSAAAARLQAVTGIDPEYQRSGMLILPPFQEDVAMRWCAQHRQRLEVVDIADHLPAIADMPGLYLPEVAQVRNPRLLQALRKHVEMLGGTILEQHEVHGFDIADGRVAALQTAQGKLTADAYIVAAGAWSKVLLGQHALHMDIKPIRGQILLFKFDQPQFRNILLQDNLYLIPRCDGHVLVGSTLEDAGFDKSTTIEARDNLLQHTKAVFPQWRDQMPVNHWAGFRPGSPGNIPTIGRHPHLTNLYANSGHFRYGVTMSFASAELLLNEIEGKPQPYSVEAYRWN